MSSTAERLLDVAQALVQHRGYHGFSYADLAKAVGIKTASIHYHFPTKEDLARALVIRYRSRFQERLAALATEEPDPVARIERYVGFFRETFAADGRICVCASLAADALTLGDSIGGEVREFFAASEDWLRTVLDEAAAAGLIRPRLATGGTARAIVAGLEGSMLTARVAGSPQRIDEMAAWLRAVLTET